MFLVLEGPDGVGKSTQLARLQDFLRERTSRDVLRFAEPGGTELGLAVRRILLDTSSGELSAATELFLFMAARSQLVEKEIRPALHSGASVLCDRFLWSSVVYQGIVGGVGEGEVLRQGRLATCGCMPDHTFVLDLTPEEARRRARNRGTVDRFERKGEAYHRSVREAFLAVARRHGDAITVIPADGSVDEVQERLRSAVAAKGFLQAGGATED